MQTARNEDDPYNPAPAINSAHVEHDCTKPERSVRVYSYWGSPSDYVGEDGDFVFEEITGSLIGPKANGTWPQDFIRIEGPVIGKPGCFPRWRRSDDRLGANEWFLTGWFKTVTRFLMSGGRVKPHSV
jgi:hypothetical protein